jgi:hypothetical protein
VFGIRKGLHTLCHVQVAGHPGATAFLPEEFVAIPVLRETAYEIDQLLQTIIVSENDYSLTVFELTEDQSQIFVINRLKGVRGY